MPTMMETIIFPFLNYDLQLNMFKNVPITNVLSHKGSQIKSPHAPSPPRSTTLEVVPRPPSLAFLLSSLLGELLGFELAKMRYICVGHMTCLLGTDPVLLEREPMGNSWGNALFPYDSVFLGPTSQHSHPEELNPNMQTSGAVLV